MPAYFSAKDERMYKHVLASTGSKRVAAATVNKYRVRAGTAKSSRKRKKRRKG